MQTNMSAVRGRNAWTCAALAALLVGGGDCAAATVEAYSGPLFGVARVTLPVGGGGPVTPTDDERFTVGGADGRVLYPVVMGDRPVRRLLRDLLEIDRPRSATIYFLFRGSEPLEIEAYAPTAQKVRVVPRTDGRAYQRLLGEWWEHYAARWQRLQRDPQFPPIVENFLTANLSRRLQLQLPAAPSGLPALLQPKKSVWDDLFVSERRQMALDQMLLTDDAATAEGQDPADPLPAPMPWYELRTADNLEPSLIEAMAEHVPVEAFYVRFGTFSNYLWFRDLNRKWHGDLANMILRRSVDRAASQRIEQQLSLRENALAKILGPQVIADVAIIGLDPQINYGAAIGVLFHARVSPLLARDLTEQRREALTKFPDAAESTVSIGDRQVSLIATPHGEVRSYYIADGDFHLVTTSRRLVQRFLEAGAGERALAASAGFRQARQRLAHDRGDAIFAYLSPEFFREQTSPALWIESQRRALSDRRSKLIALVRLQALAEGVAAEGLAELADVDLLPRSLAATASEQLQFDAEGAVDLLRGRVGYFVPAPDVEVEHASAAEAAAYRRFADRFRQEVGQMPPLAVGVRRVPLADGSGETLAADIVAAPLEGLKLGRLPNALGPPAAERMGPIDGDVLRIELVLDSPPLLPLLGGAGELHHLFVGVRDFRSPLTVDRGRLGAGAPRAELVRMYVGAWPKPGLLKLFGDPQLAEGPEPTPAGADVWQGKREDVLLMSFKPDVVQEILPQLTRTPVERPGQLWVDVADLSGTEISATVNALGYARGRESSLAASRLMNTLAHQLHVPWEQCRDVAERLVDGTFVCPLGGEYELADVPGGRPLWASTAVTPQNRFLLDAPPEDFQTPALSWFRGLRADLSMVDAELAGHLEIDLARSAVP